MAKKRAAAGQDAPAKKTVKKAAKAAKAAPAAKKTAKAAKAAAPKKKAAAVKLNDKQKDLMQRIKAAGEAGLPLEKGEMRSAMGLREKKLLKGKTNKETKATSFWLTKAGEKALSSSAASNA